MVRSMTHPLVQHHLSRLRDQDTTPEEFRRLIRRISVLLATEALADLPVEPVSITTPPTMVGHQIHQRVGLVPILRAGLGMVEPFLDLLPDAEVWHLGLFRDEATLQPVEYYQKFQHAMPMERALVLDPMLATGGSIIAAVAALHKWGVPIVRIVSVIAAPEGLAAIHKAFPEVMVHVAAVDERLNERGFIFPGLGDAGDRTFNTGGHG
jgi:uracil phosphoribosyltransferase